MIPANNEVEDGIRRVAVMLQNGNIKIHRSCEDCIKEFGEYRWDDKAREDKVIKEHDHAMDDVRYFANTIMQHKVRIPDRKTDDVPPENKWLADHKKSLLGGRSKQKIYR